MFNLKETGKDAENTSDALAISSTYDGKRKSIMEKKVHILPKKVSGFKKKHKLLLRINF